MAAVRANLTVVQGEDWAYLFEWDEAPGDLTGATGQAQVRTTRSASTVLHEWNTSLGNMIVDSDGITLYVTPPVSSAWNWTKGVYDVEVTIASKVTRVARGRVTVDQEVTR